MQFRAVLSALYPAGWLLTTDLDLICRKLPQHFTLRVPVDAEVFYLQLLLSEELLGLQIQQKSVLTSKSQASLWP